MEGKGWILPFEHDLLEMIGAYPDQQNYLKITKIRKSFASITKRRDINLTERTKNFKEESKKEDKEVKEKRRKKKEEI